MQFKDFVLEPMRSPRSLERKQNSQSQKAAAETVIISFVHHTVYTVLTSHNRNN